jgi:hypothetical protein
MEGILNSLSAYWHILLTLFAVVAYVIRVDWKVRNTMASKTDIMKLENLLSETSNVTGIQLQTIQDYLNKQSGSLEKNLLWHDHHIETYHSKRNGNG